jgi:hypothetical protein
LTQTNVRVILIAEQMFGRVNAMFMNKQLLERSAGSLSSSSKYAKCTVKRSISHSVLARFLGMLAAAMFIIIFSLSVSLLGGDQDAYAASNATHFKQSIEVVKGDTLWDIAGRHVHKGQNVRNYMNEIKTLNGLKSSILHEGQLIVLP